MTAPKFTVEQGENGPEYFEGESKLAFTNASGTLQFTRGNAERREEVEAWIKRHEAHAAKSEGPTGEPASSADEVPSEHNEQAVENVIADQTDSQITESPNGVQGEPETAQETGQTVSPTASANETKDSTHLERITLPIICPIVGASHLGDKDPAVVDWWRKNHPEEFKKRYYGRRLQSASGIIV